MGDGCSIELIRDVAKAGNGKATFVKDSDRLQSKVMSVLKVSIQCGITDVTLTWSLLTGCTVINVKENVSAIFDGEMVILYCIISGNVEEDIDIWATALAVAFLRKNFLEQREEWEMVEEKVLKWLSTKTNEGEDILQEASRFLS